MSAVRLALGSERVGDCILVPWDPRVRYALESALDLVGVLIESKYPVAAYFVVAVHLINDEFRVALDCEAAQTLRLCLKKARDKAYVLRLVIGDVRVREDADGRVISLPRSSRR